MFVNDKSGFREEIFVSKFTEYIGSQFGNPHGFVGKICCILMNIINNRVTYEVVQDIRIEAFNRLEILPLSYIDSHFKKRRNECM